MRAERLLTFNGKLLYVVQDEKILSFQVRTEEMEDPAAI